LEKTTPHLLYSKLEETNSEAALRYIPHHYLTLPAAKIPIGTVEVQILPLNGKITTS